MMRSILRDIAVVIGVYLGLAVAQVIRPHQPIEAVQVPTLTRSTEVEPRSTIVARGKLTSAEHEQIEGSYELISYATNGTRPVPGLSLKFPAESMGPLLMREYVNQRVVIRVEVER